MEEEPNVPVGDSADDTLRVLVATDNHLGFAERDPIRMEDSFNTFEEILQTAQKLKVDMILLGGDLFHDNKPSRRALYRTMELMRTYCFGDNPIKINILSDQSLNFPKFGRVNYEDPNFNISIPVFSIHGNHDDPAGDGGYSALDLLNVCNFVNYFGKSDSCDDVTVYPILLSKGITKVALYGLGNIRDERLYRTFQQKKVKLMRPIEAIDEWFNIFVLHQNRVAHTPKNAIHEAMLDNFLDFVIWGHEHECKITPQSSAVGDFFITQPGSSVATSLSDGEAKKKHIGLLEICKDQFRLKPIALKTVRPFIMEDIVLKEYDVDPNEHDLVIEFLAQKVEEMIIRASKEFRKKSSKMPTMPLIRLRVDYTGFSTVNPQRFGQRFVGRVANPNEILLFHKKRNAAVRAKGETEESLLLRATRPEPLDDTRIEDLIASFLGPAQKLELLPEHELNFALHNFIEKDEKSAITEFVSKKLTDTQKYLQQDDPEKTLLLDYIQSAVNERTAKSRAEAPQHFYSQSDDSSSALGDGSTTKAEPGKKKKKGKVKASDDEEPEQDGEKEAADNDSEDEKPKSKKKKEMPKPVAVPKTKAAGGKKTKGATKETAKTKKAAAKASAKKADSRYALELTKKEPGGSDSKTPEKEDKPQKRKREEPKPAPEGIKVEKIEDDDVTEIPPPPKQKRRINDITDLLAVPAGKAKTEAASQSQNEAKDKATPDPAKKVTKGWGARRV